MYLKIVKAICDKPMANIKLILKNWNHSPPKIRNETKVPTIPTPIQHSTEFLARAIRQEEEIKEIQIGKVNILKADSIEK
jgi:hypothetical protein